SARNSAVTSGVLPNQRAKLGAAWRNNMPVDGTLVFESNMDGVEILVDGMSRGIVNKGSPLRLPGLRPGNHTVQGVKLGYEPDGPREETVYPGVESTVSIKILIARRRTKAAVDQLNEGLEYY